MLNFRAVVVALLLLVSGATAGCFGKDDETDTGTGATDDGGDMGDPGTGGTDDTGTGTGGSGTNDTSPPPPPKPSPVNESFRISLGPGGGPTPPTGEHPFNVPGPNWASFTVTVSVQGPQDGLPILADKVTVVVLDPEGGEQGRAEFSAGPPGGAQTISVGAGAPGAGWKVQATAATAAVSATVSGTISITY